MKELPIFILLSFHGFIGQHIFQMKLRISLGINFYIYFYILSGKTFGTPYFVDCMLNLYLSYSVFYLQMKTCFLKCLTGLQKKQWISFFK